MAEEPEVLHQRQGCAGIAVLNRPKALNALNTNMVLELYRLYREWGADPSVHCVIIKGAGGRAFCSGGDIKAVVQQAREGRPHEAAEFFRAEYRTNHAIQQLPKPHVALIDGITMGGGMGVSVHGPIRVATERTLFAMPECAIGLFPDVGGSWFLPRLPDCMGAYLALTGARLKGLEVKQAGVATHYVDSALLPELEQRICALGTDASSVSALDQIIQEFEGRTHARSNTPLERHIADIRTAFCQPSLEQVYEQLQGRADEWGNATLALMHRGSPLSQRVTWQQLQAGSDLGSLRDCLVMEARLAYHMVSRESDFAEGVRAMLLDKDNAPAWRYATIQAVPKGEVDAFFAPLGEADELQLPPTAAPGQARL